MNNRLGLATVFHKASDFWKSSTPELWQPLPEGGFFDAEIDVDNEKNVCELCAESEKVWHDLKAAGVIPSSFHLPFGNAWDVSAKDDAVRKKAIDELTKLLCWAGRHQINIAVLHPSFEPIDDSERSERLRLASDSIRTLSKSAAQYGVRIAVENLPRTCLGNCADEILVLTDFGKTASICLDVNHLLKEKHADFIDKTGPYIITTHLSDYDFIDEKHWLPGDGMINWKELKESLDKAGYDGRYLFELGDHNSLSLQRPYTPAELAERFRKLIK